LPSVESEQNNPSLRGHLLKMGISEENWASVADSLSTNGGSLTEGLIKKKIISEEALLAGLSDYFAIPFLRELPLDHLHPDLADRVPQQYLKKYRLIPLENSHGLTIVMNDPTHYAIADELSRLLDHRDYETALSTRDVIMAAIGMAYDLKESSAKEFLEEINGESPDQIISEIDETADLLDEKSEAPIIKLVNLLLTGALKDRASDIHIEPYQFTVKVRYRIDGILYDVLNLPRRIQSPLVSRIKIMSKLNIAEKRLPQDGRIEIRLGDRNVDIRVSVLPTSFGERVVLRLLDKTQALLQLTDLGMEEKTGHLFSRLIKFPFGIILVTGPTGSGKTTTLYTALTAINSSEINIITIEDPIEYQIDGIGQIQVNPKIDLTFAQGLRSIVRQDPDVILVGEIRDRETAEIAIQSSLTGHLVFSTLHTNDAAGAVTRLIDMGIEPFLVTSSIVAVVAQRLVRVLCPKCKEAYIPGDEALAHLGIDAHTLGHHTLYRKRGCAACMYTGYRGRTAIFEIMIMEDAVKKLVLKTSDANLIHEEALKQGMKPLLDAGVGKVLAGVTTPEEVFRVTRMVKRDGETDL